LTDKDKIHYLKTEDAGVETLYTNLTAVLEEDGEGMNYESILGVLVSIMFDTLMENYNNTAGEE
jgi:hypothetical protein